METSEVQKICLALDSLLKPNIDNVTRTEALKLCESYKSDPRCAEVGFHLANATDLPPNVRYYGLQLIKHRVRMHWTTMSKEEKLAMKSLTLNLISSCSKDEATYIKSLLASIINEIVKHVWPQLWACMIDEMIETCNSAKDSGALEVLILFFLMLSEDVAVYQNVALKSRARDLRHGLSVEAPNVFEFLFATLKTHSSQLVASVPSYHDHLVKVTLEAVESYVEWINLKVVYAENGVFFETLFLIFNFENLRVVAVSCLNAIVSRKGHLNDKKLLLKLTEEGIVQKYAVAIKEASLLEGFSEANFQFLFTMGNVIFALANLLINLWQDGEKKTVDCPNEFNSRRNFLETIYFMSGHGSKVVAQTVLMAWVHFLRHEEIQKEESLQSLIPLLVDLASQNLTRKNVRTQNQFSTLEATFVNDSDELAVYMDFYRHHLIDVLRRCAMVAPLIVLEKCFDCVKQSLSSNYGSAELAQNQMESVLCYLESVVHVAVGSVEEREEVHLLPTARAEKLLKLILSKKSGDLVVMRYFLLAAYSLLRLLPHSSDPVSYFKLLVDHLFYILDETAGDTANPQVGPLRRQVGATMVRTAKAYSKILVNLTEHLKKHVLKRLSVNPCKLFSFEKVSMFEALILISAEWNNFDQQSKLIADVMATIVPMSQAPSFVEALRGPLYFAKGIGVGIVTNAQDIDITTDPTAELRSNFYYYAALVFAVLSRSEQLSKDLSSPNPAAPHLSLALDHVLLLLHLITSMWSPEIRDHFAPENLKALEMRDCERRALICQTAELAKTEPDEKAKSHWERLQIFLVLTLDLCYMSIGLLGRVLNSDFYRMPQLLQIMLQKMFANIEHLDCVRLKSFLRQFLLPFFKACPIENVNDIVSPLLQAYCQFIMERLQPAWNAYGKRQFERLEGAENIDDVEEQEENEMLEEQILRIITREHVDLLTNVILNKNPRSHKLNAQHGQTNGNITMTTNENYRIDQVTGLGAAIVSSPACEHVLFSTLRALTWHDTTTCQKCLLILGPLLKQLLQTSPNRFNEELTRFVLESVLHGLARHGEHDGCEAPLCALLLMLIQSLKSRADIVTEVLLSTQQTEEGKIEMLEFIRDFEQLIDKKRKLQFRKLLSHIIIRHAGQRFKEIPEMNTFDPIPKRKKIEVKTEVESFGLAELFRPT